MKSTNSLVAVGCAIALSACGGGGGNAGTTTPAPTSTLSYIAPADAAKAAGNGYAAGALLNQSSTSLTDIVAGVSVAPAQLGVVTPVLDLVKRALHVEGGRLLTGVTMSNACSGGGNVTINATLKNENTLSNGDTLTMTATNCIESGSTLNGALSITMSGVSADFVNGTAGAVTMDTRFTGFSVGEGSITDTLNGDMKIALNIQSATDLSIAVSGASLQASEQKSGTTVATRTLTAYSMTGSVHGTTVTAASSFSVSGSANGLGQFAYTVKNLKQFVSSTTSDQPTAGSLIVNGKASSVTATVVSNGIRLDYSAKGDGVTTQSSTVVWNDFLAGA
jgi:hypothetical protein